MKRSERTRTLSLCSLLAALGVVILLLGSIFDVLDLSAAILASALTVIAVIEAGGFWPWLTYIVIFAVSILVLPNKAPSVIFLLSGYYPMIKEKLEKLNSAVAWIVKLVVFNVSMTVLLLIFKQFIPSVDLSLIEGMDETMTYIVIYAVGNLIFVLYDILLTRLISLYVYKLRDMLKLGRRKRK